MSKFEYVEKVYELLDNAIIKNEENIKILAEKFAENIMANKVIHTFGTGHSHMIGIELFARAGGLGNVNAILDPDCLTSFGAQRSGKIEKLEGLADIIFESYNISKGDIMIITSNSGRNPVPIEMAMRCKKEGIYTIALTNLKQSKSTPSRHKSNKNLYELVDCIIDNCVPSGDSLLNVGNIKTGPGSSIVSMFLLNTIVVEAIKICDRNNFKAPVFQSQNVDGFDNDSIYENYKNNVKHF